MTRYHRENRQPKNDLDIAFRSHGRILHFHEKSVQVQVPAPIRRRILRRQTAAISEKREYPAGSRGPESGSARSFGFPPGADLLRIDPAFSPFRRKHLIRPDGRESGQLVFLL